MAQDIHIRREHALGLAKARELARAWAERVERDHAMDCTLTEGERGDAVDLARPGVTGRVIVAADHFDLRLRLGLVAGLFAARIEAEIEQQFDALLGAAPERPSWKKAGAAKKR